MTRLFGIKNCDTIKKAKKWLDEHNIEYQFHDYRVDGIERSWLEHMASELGWKALLNQRGTTFRNLPEEQKSSLDESTAIDLMLNAPAMIKRPLLQHNDTLLLGFKPELYENAVL